MRIHRSHQDGDDLARIAPPSRYSSSGRNEKTQQGTLVLPNDGLFDGPKNEKTRKSLDLRVFRCALAERVRFELTVPLKVHRISSPAHSTTLPPFRVFRLAAMRRFCQIQAGRCLREKDYRTADLDFQVPLSKNFEETWQSDHAVASAQTSQPAGSSSRSTPPI